MQWFVLLHAFPMTFQVWKLVAINSLWTWSSASGLNVDMLTNVDQDRMAHFLMLLTRSAAAGSFILSRNSAKLNGAVASANCKSSAMLSKTPVRPDAVDFLSETADQFNSQSRKSLVTWRLSAQEKLSTLWENESIPLTTLTQTVHMKNSQAEACVLQGAG